MSHILLRPALLAAPLMALSLAAMTGVGWAQEAAPPFPTFRDCADCPEMVSLPPGRFVMGSTDEDLATVIFPEALGLDVAGWEKPARAMRILHPFALGSREVTVAQYAAFVAANPGRAFTACKAPSEHEAKSNWQEPGFPQGPDHPVVCVSWQDAADYAAWLAAETGQPYRLPSEAEWEYAARAGTVTARYYGTDTRLHCRYENGPDLTRSAAGFATPELFSQDGIMPDFVCADGHVHTAPVGSFKANPWGVYDMLGNVREWTADCYHKNLIGVPEDGRAWVLAPAQCGPVDEDGYFRGRILRSMRGASFSYAPYGHRAARRGFFVIDHASPGVGFRVARDLQAPNYGDSALN
jgi:formylglycine-generating enzyme required for sulfatase activity